MLLNDMIPQAIGCGLNPPEADLQPASLGRPRLVFGAWLDSFSG